MNKYDIEIKPGDVSRAIEESFTREHKYGTMKIGDLRKSLTTFPKECDEWNVVFSFVLKDYGDRGNGTRKFMLGTIPIKCVMGDGHRNEMVLCDDRLKDFVKNFTKSESHSIPSSVKQEEEVIDEDFDLRNCEQCGERTWDGYICHSCGLKNI